MNLTLVLTHDCNLRCRYCYAGKKFGRAMSWDVAKRALDLEPHIAGGMRGPCPPGEIEEGPGTLENPDAPEPPKELPK